MSTRAAACIASASRRGFTRQAAPRSEREGRAAIDHAIEIVAGACAAPGVEIVGHALGADDRHGMGTKQRIEPLAEPERGPVALKVDMRDLAPRMHAGVCAPRAMSGHAGAGHRGESALQNLLHREAVVLSLPADERRPVVFDRQPKPGHAPPGPTRRGERPRWPSRTLSARVTATGDVEAQAAARLFGAAERGPGTNIIFRVSAYRATSAALAPSGRRAHT